MYSYAFLCGVHRSITECLQGVILGSIPNNKILYHSWYVMLSDIISLIYLFKWNVMVSTVRNICDVMPTPRQGSVMTY